jgi:hypothetical protein
LVDEAFLDMLHEIFNDFKLDGLLEKNPHLKDELTRTFEAAKELLKEYFKKEVKDPTPEIPTLSRGCFLLKHMISKVL